MISICKRLSAFLMGSSYRKYVCRLSFCAIRLLTCISISASITAGLIAISILVSFVIGKEYVMAGMTWNNSPLCCCIVQVITSRLRISFENRWGLIPCILTPLDFGYNSDHVLGYNTRQYLASHIATSVFAVSIFFSLLSWPVLVPARLFLEIANYRSSKIDYWVLIPSHFYGHVEQYYVRAAGRKQLSYDAWLSDYIRC